VGERLKVLHRSFVGALSDMMPKGLYARALIIIIAPIVVLEGVIAFVFMERHWQNVTRRLSETTARDIAALIDIYQSATPGEYDEIIRIARDRLNLSMQILPPGDLPEARQKPFFDLLDRALSREISRQVKMPFWIDTVGQSRHVEVRVKLDQAVLRFTATRSQTYPSNSHIFLVWMVVTAVILLVVAILFMRNQIKPIQRLADAADAFGKGRAIPDDFKPRGALEVRKAAEAFIEMRDRIMTHVDQRTTMLAGVSHDLRTVLTRFRLELAMLPPSQGATAMRADVDEMQHMLEDYLAFAKGDGGEIAKPTGVYDLIEEVQSAAAVFGTQVHVAARKRHHTLLVPLKRNAFKRALMNLVANAARYGKRVVIRLEPERRWLRVEVDDDGPGIPEHERENVFRPFYRIDDARRIEKGGNSGLGLAIARDIARSHGGDIELGESPLGGLKAVIRVPI